MAEQMIKARTRIPAAERRSALIDAAVEEFAEAGLHGTPVDRIARRVGVAQPYVFSLFASKRELFLAAVERGFERVHEMFMASAEAFNPAIAEAGKTVLDAMGKGYVEMLTTDQPLLMLQLQAYAACDDPLIRDRVRAAYARLVGQVIELSGASTEEIDEFMRYGMWLTAAAAMGVEDLSSGCDWMRAGVSDADALTHPQREPLNS